MTSVDNKIVSMQFDNAAFERKMSDTLKSLDKLSQTLEMAGAKRGLQELDDASKRFNMGPMGSAVDGVSNKFLALATVAITALSNITNRAVDAGMRFVKSFTFGPVMQGFQEFETNMNSIQTILANTKSKGSTLEDVNGALDKLNTYADQTIYNFSEMARNIGTFTAAGVDLDQSVNAIKGIANLAAISGSNSQQASTAMYQLSQALAAGKVNLMDWNSVVNAGMGGEVFKKALFETGKAMGTITDVPLSASFEEWEKKGGTFREQMQKGWMTADVLSTTLEAFSGDLDAAGLSALGFSDAAAQEMLELGKMGQAAATEVKTFTQLVGTVQEAIGSGWSQSFRTVIGDFEESKKLFTEISEGIGGIVGKSADARNKLLEGWKMRGGRDMLISGLREAIEGLGSIIAPIKEAFRDIFPPMTARRLVELTRSFQHFAMSIKIGGETADKIKRIFSGLFSVIEIGWEVLKGVFGFFKSLASEVLGASGGLFDFAANMGDTLTSLNEALVEGGGIAKFFEKLTEAVKKPIAFVRELAEAIQDFFNDGAGSNAIESGTERVGQRFESLGNALQWLSEKTQSVRDAFSKLWEYISTWFKELGSKLAAEMTEGDFDAAVDILNVGLLGGIAMMLKKFLKGGLNIDFGGGIVEKINDGLSALTGQLEAMQANLKATALLKIAGAIALITASVLVLSTIDSGALTKAMTAMAVGFGQLMGAMTIMTKFTTGFSAAKINLIATAMIGMAAAVTVLSVAMKIMASMSWEELARGLAGVTVSLGVLTTATKLIAADVSGILRASVAMSAMAFSLIILGGAMKIFATMSWEEMGKGLAGVAGGLGTITLAMNAMPKSGMVQAGAGILAISGAMVVLSFAVKQFSSMDWGEMAKGLAGVAVGLGAIVLATNTMPAGGMIGIGIGLIAVSASLVIMAKAIEAMGNIDFGTMAKGIGGLAVTLGLLVVATNLMTGAAAGAAALVVVSGALLILTKVIKEMGSLSLGELAIGLGGVAAVLLILGGAALLLGPLIPTLLGLGAALALLGVGFALFGVGAMAVAKAFEIMARAGEAGVDVVIGVLKRLLTVMPEIAGAIAQALIEFATEILEAAPLLVKSLKVLLLHLLDTVIELAPKIAEALGEIISEGLKLIREKFPELVDTGYEMLLAILGGIRDNIGDIVSTVSDIVVNFLEAFTEELPNIREAMVDALAAWFQEVAYGLGELMPKLTIGLGRSFLEGFWNGITEELGKVGEFIGSVVRTIIDTFKSLFGIKSPSTVMLEIGKDVIQGLLEGLKALIGLVKTFFIELPGKALSWVGDVVGTLVGKGRDFITGLFSGITNKMVEVFDWFKRLGTKVLDAVPNLIETLLRKGRQIIIGLWNGIKEIFEDVKDWFGRMVQFVRNAVPNMLDALYEIGKDIIRGLWRGVLSMKDWFMDKMKETKGWVKDPVSLALSILSPSREMAKLGVFIMEGLVVGMESMEKDVRASSGGIGESVKLSMRSALMQAYDTLSVTKDFNPTIAPVLDLTRVQSEARKINGMMSVSTLRPDVSFNQARDISSATTALDEDSTPETPEPREIKFEQNIYAPEALSANDIYRNTKSQIALAKEELGAS